MSPVSRSRQCCFAVLGPAGYGNYIAWKEAAEARGMNPNECHRWAVDEVDGRPYCAQHAKRQRKLSEFAKCLDAIDANPVPNDAPDYVVDYDGVRRARTMLLAAGGIDNLQLFARITELEVSLDRESRAREMAEEQAAEVRLHNNKLERVREAAFAFVDANPAAVKSWDERRRVLRATLYPRGLEGPKQEFSCDSCGHFSGDHSQRMSDSEQAPCQKCGCEDFQSEAADNAGSDETVRQAWDVTPPGWGGENKREAVIALVVAARFALLYHDEPCRPDHHGYCQAHNLEPVELCWVPTLRKALAALRITEDGTSLKGNRST